MDLGIGAGGGPDGESASDLSGGTSGRSASNIAKSHIDQARWQVLPLDGQSVAIDGLAGDQSIGLNVHVVAVEMGASGGHTVDRDEDLWARGRRVKHLLRDGLEEEALAEISQRLGFEAWVISGNWLFDAVCEITLWHVDIHVFENDSEFSRVTEIMRWVAVDIHVHDPYSTIEEGNTCFDLVCDSDLPITERYIVSHCDGGWIKRIGAIDPEVTRQRGTRRGTSNFCRLD